MPTALALAAVLAGQAASAEAWPTVAGTRPSEDCGGLREMVGPDMRCVVTTFGEANDLAFAHLAEARRQGWTDAGGAANALWMQKRAADGACLRLTVAAFWDFRTTPQPREDQPAYVGLLVEPAQTCPPTQTIPNP